MGGPAEATGSAPATVEISGPVASPGSFHLAPGLWSFSLSADGLWAAPMIASISESTTVEFQLYRATRIRGTVAVPKGVDLPREIRVEFRRGDEESSLAMPRGEVECPIDGTKWSCLLPAGTFDLSLRAFGFVPQYRWGLEVPARKEWSFGNVLFEKGSSLSGSVQFDRRRKLDPRDVTVTLSPVAAVASQSIRSQLRRIITHPNARGFFQLAAPPGDFRLQATAPGLISEPRTVRILGDVEAQLEKALILNPPRTLRFTLDPPLDPFGHPWHLLLTRWDENHSAEEEVPGMLTHGIWEHGGLVPGHYSVTVSRTAKDRWFSDRFDVAGDGDVDRSVNLRLAWLTGQVTLGGKPITAAVILGGTDGEVSIPFRTRPDGTFKVIVPEPTDQIWSLVDVRSDELSLHRTLHNVGLQYDEEAGADRMNIDLPGRALSGQVVDEEGNVQSYALIDVSIMPSDESYQMQSDSGAFAIAGLGPGTVVLSATTKTAAQEAPVRVTVTDDTDPEPVVLTVKPRTTLRGIVETPQGPAGGARIVVLPSMNGSTAYVVPRATDVDGTFSVPIPPGNSEAFVSAAVPGYAWTMMRTPVQSDPPVLVTASADGGTLSINTASERDGMLAVLIHNGAMFSAWTLNWLAGVPRVSPHPEDVSVPAQISVPLAESGDYAICWMPEAQYDSGSVPAVVPENCSSGFLSLGGHLNLDLSEKKP